MGTKAARARRRAEWEDLPETEDYLHQEMARVAAGNKPPEEKERLRCHLLTCIDDIIVRRREMEEERRQRKEKNARKEQLKIAGRGAQKQSSSVRSLQGAA